MTETFNDKNERKVIRPERISAEQRMEEGLMLKAALKANGMTQNQLGDFLDLSQANISQWFRAPNPAQIPDWAFAACAARLNFNPSKFRPHLKEMNKNLTKALSSESELNNKKLMLVEAFDLLPEPEKFRLLGHLEALAAKK